MSSTSRSPGDKPEGDESQRGRPASPGRYSHSTEGSTQMAAVRIDSTRMVAVRPDPVEVAAAALPPPPPATPPRAAETAAAPPPLLPPRPSASGPRAAARNAEPPKPSDATAPAAARRVPPPPLPAKAREVEGPDRRRPQAPLPKGGGASALLAASAPPPAPLASRAPAALAPRLTPIPPSKGSWLPPPPPPKRDATRLPSGETASFAGFDEGSIASAFDALLSEGTCGREGQAVVDLAPVRELFAELAANHMRHVRDFMIDVKWGEAPREWIEICVPAVTSLRRAAERLDLTELASALDVFLDELRVTASGPSDPRTIEGATRDRLLAGYEKLVDVLPQAFALARDTTQREAVIIQSLCLSVPDVRKVTIDKLHAAGLTSLKMLFDAKADEIAQVAGIPEALATRIVERFQAYRCELQNASPQDARAAERDRLATLTSQLREQHEGYEDAARAWSPEAKAKKRDLFRAREESWLAISLLLARFGEVDRLQGIEKVPYGQRLTQLSDYLEEARSLYRSE